MFATKDYLQFLYKKYFLTNKMMVVKVTNKCNLACEHCRECSGPDKNDILDWNVFTTVMDKIADKDWNSTLQGGEPTLFMDVVEEMTKYHKQKNILSTLYTNGWWAFDDNICNRIEKMQPDILTVSVNEWTNKLLPINNSIEILNRFENSNIKLIISEVHKQGGPVIYPKLNTNVALSSYVLSPVGRAKDLNIYNDKDFYKKEWTHCFQCGFTLEKDLIYANCCAGTKGCCFGSYLDFNENNRKRILKCEKLEEFYVWN